MDENTVELEMPLELFWRLRYWARERGCTIEELILERLDAVLPPLEPHTKE